MTGRARPIHVERTDDPAVLRWVLHHPVVVAAPVGRRTIPPGSPLGRLLANGSITEVVIRRGDALIRVDDPATWTTLASTVQSAILRELNDLDATEGHWILDAERIEAASLSVDEIQRLVDRAAGPVMTAHGGHMIVAGVAGSTVHLRAEGACHGCVQSDDTLIGLIVPAVQAADPTIMDVVIDPTDRAEHDSSSGRRVRTVQFRRRDRRDGPGH
jgi:Fe-S cluster biogenesis protein NfuA